WRPSPALRIGASFQGPTRITGSGTFKFRLPSSAFFDGAKVNGDQLDMALTLPLAVRAGIEWAPARGGRTPGGPPPSRDLKIELAVTWEKWSMFDKIEVRPRGVTITGVPVVGTYEVGRSDLPLGYRDSVAIALGGEWTVLKRGRAPRLVLRAGYAYERGAASDE